MELHPELRNLRFVVTEVKGGYDIDLRRFAADGRTLLGGVRGVVNGKLCVADDLEASLAEGDAWFSSLKTRMDEYAEKNGILPFEERPEEKPASAVAPSATEAHALLELGTPYGRR